MDSKNLIFFTLVILHGSIGVICQMLHEPDELMPEFYAPLENWTVSQGRDVYFTCTVNNLGKYKVAWIKSDSKAILAIHTNLIAHNHRLTVTHNGHNTWKLNVIDVQKNDTGSYMCQINTIPMILQTGYLDVRIPPNIVDEDDIEGPGSAAMEGGTIRLRCRSTGKPEPKVHWKRKDNRLIVIRSDGAKEESATVKGDTLELSNVHRTDMGKYLCIAKNNVPPSVSKEFNVQIHFHPMIKVTNQLVAAPIGSNVLIQCYVETSPKAMHIWAKMDGADLMPNSKYKMSESPINEYSLQMNLTITNLELKDFGGYLCMAKNALGKAEGSIRLQELHLPRAPTTAEPPESEPEDDDESPSESEEANLVPHNDVTAGGGSGNGRSPDGSLRQTDQQREHPPPSTRNPSLTGHNGNGNRHKDNRQRHGGGKGSGVRHTAAGWTLLTLAAAVAAATYRWTASPDWGPSR
ncbi:Immunoglobulin subtype,Immunoglobulin-like domain,Immunoglobulin-like fold,Immunoglobulin V-set [Cinara cedri]|uniref:Immunoglobulin subtype,Immunoglobulin-like domain,Immunoglobulin-like fold,Immunoglobulin V-set n=1 Tax=Cinara cedri TaxID=506608 RepID=A0A5E4NFU0_9HEMI|nr:Immunoglobulin subtype,Immunoglobulin-like domain,Immunoglobulin-like fold,Immunoglobulin V-set [Cinara cedri]